MCGLNSDQLHRGYIEMSDLKRVLIANRGEIALRLIRAAKEYGFIAVTIYSEDDTESLHVSRADVAILLQGKGPAAYLDSEKIVKIALENDCFAIHPGYGFLSERVSFLKLVESSGLVFIGPTCDQLALLGDKEKACKFASKQGLPTLLSSGILKSSAILQEFREKTLPDRAVILKAVSGGGGRGLRVVEPGQDGEALLSEASAEANTAFGDSRLYAEDYRSQVRHIEVQVVGDGKGGVCHLWERDCSLQRRHQKVLEITPAPFLSTELRDRILNSATILATAIKYKGLGTIEFLVDTTTDEYFFIEANARLQVEHTITEEVLGIDLVCLQFDIALGRTLKELDLERPPELRGSALQLRINGEELTDNGDLLAADGILNRYEPSAGPGIRVDGCAFSGYQINPLFDSLLAKLIVHVNTRDIDKLLQRAEYAVSDFVAEGMSTNLPFLNALVRRKELLTADFSTTFLDEKRKSLLEQSRLFVKAEVVSSAGVVERAKEKVPDGSLAIEAPMRGSVVSISVGIGDEVGVGQHLGFLEAMKMHHEIVVSKPGVVREILIKVSEVVDKGTHLFYIEPLTHGSKDVNRIVEYDLSSEREDLSEVQELHALGLDENRSDAMTKRAAHKSRTARENVEHICDADTFIEYGALAIAAQRRRRSIEDLRLKTPADGMIAGFGNVNGGHFEEEKSRCAILAYDYTVLAGTQGHNNHKKKDRIFELAQEWETPVVFFTEGGGGRPGDVDTEDLIMSWLDIKTFATWPKLNGIAPRIAINSGRCFAGNAVIFGCADITIATKNSNIGLAGPAMIEGGGLGKFTPEEIGPIEVQEANGVVDIVTDDEHDATVIAKRVLSCFQGSLKEWSCDDQRLLRHIVPENRLRVYDMRQVINSLADTDSFIELRRHYGVGLITGFIRIEGSVMGLMANDPRHLGGAIDGDGGEKGGRFLQLCDVYGIPVLSLCDTPGFMVGPDSEKTAAVRRGSRLIVASANLSVPLFTVITRKGYGLGAQAMAGGSFHEPFFTIAWPTAELGPMGLEGAVELGFKKELDATPNQDARQILFDRLVGELYAKGKAVSVASTFEIDAVIDPAETRAWLSRGLKTARVSGKKSKSYVDVW